MAQKLSKMVYDAREDVEQEIYREYWSVCTQSSVWPGCQGHLSCLGHARPLGEVLPAHGAIKWHENCQPNDRVLENTEHRLSE